MNKPLNILIVDDEPLVRKGLISLLREYPEVGEVSEAGNGQTACEVIVRSRPDIVLTDIVMPKMDGIELLKWILMNEPGIKTVVLSSHQDFHYVKKAFVFGALDYVLKYDIDERSLHEAVLSAAAARIEAGGAEDTLFGSAALERPFCVLYAFEDTPAPGFKERVDKLGVRHAHRDRSAYFLYTGDDPREFARRLRTELGCSVGISSVGTDVQALRQEAETALERRFFSGPACINTFLRAPREPEGRLLQLKKDVTEEILNAGMARLYDKINALTERVREEADLSVMGVKLMYVSVVEIMSAKYPVVAADKLNKEIVEAEWFSSIAEILQSCLQAILDDSLKVIDTTACTQITRRAIDYINCHFGSGELGLDVVAAALGYTPPYLSRIFKRDTGSGVTDYINEIRILAARNMLQSSDRRVYEVAQLVGYNNYNHFSKTFKRQTGQTPTEYIENLEK